ncbi:hypothetical protein [Rhodohalobacter mucosus]|uniref:HTH araC/xylS-type domain-containing protein n=1 Tax=Rhodohalobacter mucosus TaxID=2079485 RepID=A0A316TT87_9BACT|nr:hypothetical protein [Rhodohalobacter mucosus]PWN07078.1 hypothetical protein DDZ15_07360 [Rhodohalobacter mucosus]
MKNRELDLHKSSETLHILIHDISGIRYVSDWAEAACVSPEWLRKKMNQIYSKSPSRIIRDVRYKTIVALIMEKGIDISSIEVAIDSGVGTTSDSLYKFLKRYYGITFTELKEKLLKEKHIHDTIRLNELQKYTVFTEYGDIYTEIDDSLYLSNIFKSYLLMAD